MCWETALRRLFLEQTTSPDICQRHTADENRRRRRHTKPIISLSGAELNVVRLNLVVRDSLRSTLVFFPRLKIITR